MKKLKVYASNLQFFLIRNQLMGQFLNDILGR